MKEKFVGFKQNQAYWKAKEQTFVNNFEKKVAEEKKQSRKETVNRVVNKLGGNHMIGSGSSSKGKSFKGNPKRFF